MIQYTSDRIAIGQLIGEYILDKYLPTLDIHTIHSGRVLKVSSYDKRKFNKLDKLWQDSEVGDKKPWIILHAFNREMDQKYLPKHIKCHIPIHIDLSDKIEEIKAGISGVLWNSDCCCYNIKTKHITIREEPQEYAWYGIVVELELVD